MTWFHAIGVIGLTFLATKRFRTNSPSILIAPCTIGPVSKPECTNEASMLRVSLGDWARMLLGNSARTLCPNIAKEGRDNFRCVEYSNGEKSVP